MRNCFIPRCDQICRELGETKRAMFAAPKDKETYDAWMAVLPQLRPFKPHDKVCERHFDEKYISTTYDNLINGQIYQMERGRAKLKPKAVPCRNLDLHNQVKGQTIKVRQRKAPVAPVKNVQVIEISEADNNSYEEHHLEISTDDSVQVVEEPPTSPVILYEIQTDESVVRAGVEVFEGQAQMQEIFDSLYDDIYEVILPNTLWGVHRCPERSSLFFSYVDPKALRTTKMISVSCHGDVKILLGSRLQSELRLRADVAKPEAVSEMISEIDDVKLCPRLFVSEFCEVTLKNSSEMCDNCSQIESN